MFSGSRLSLEAMDRSAALKRKRFDMKAVFRKIADGLQDRVDAGHRQVEAEFRGVSEIPLKIVKTLEDQKEERVQRAAKFRAQVEKLLEETEEQKAAREGMDNIDNLIEDLTKSVASVDKKLVKCVNSMKEAVKEFDEKTEEVEGNFETESKRKLGELNRELGDLQNRILKDGEQEAARMLMLQNVVNQIF